MSSYKDKFCKSLEVTIDPKEHEKKFGKINKIMHNLES